MAARLLMGLVFFISILSSSVYAQQTPFSRGINLTNWFQVGSAQQIQFAKYNQQDFEQIQSLGCDVIRLPINLHFMTNGTPNYELEPLFLNFLDEAVDWAEELEMHLILDNHTFDPADNTDPNVGGILEKVWRQMAIHFKDRSTFLYYEILNEPHGISDALWNEIQQNVVEVIRQEDQTHTIIVGGAGWNSYNNLDDMPVYEDDNLIYTFHFYDPFIFTHQGASWVEPSMVSLADVPFPYDATEMPELPSSLSGTWVGSAFNNYSNEGNIARVQELLDIAIQFREDRQVPIFCGEFGVFMENSNDADRVFWYDAVRQYLEVNEIAWTMWDYHGGFGLYEPGSNGLFDHDLNVPLLDALGLDAPPQSEFVLTPDSVGFFIYSDFIGPNIIESSFSNGPLSFYSTDLPNNGNYSIRWEDAGQYNAVGFDFRPNKDLSYLVDNGFALDFLVRGDTPGTSIDLRFLDTDTADPEDHPWRIRITLGDNEADWDSRWHHIHVPLEDFTEHGAWENEWFPPVGDFDWTAIDRFEIVAEHSDLNGIYLWFDNIQITDQDTALVYETSVFTSAVDVSLAAFDLTVFPNPASDFLQLETTLTEPLEWSLMDGRGSFLQKGSFQEQTYIDISKLIGGFYFLAIRNNQGAFRSWKILKQ